MNPEQMDAEMREMVAEKVASRIWEKIEKTVEELSLVSVPRACGMLDLSTSQAYRAFDETVNMGPRDTKVTLSSLRQLIAKRTVKKGKKKGSRA